MDFMTAMDVSASGLTAQRIRMNIISMNLANTHTTRTPHGGPYIRKSVLMAAVPVGDEFDRILQAGLGQSLNGVEVIDIVNDRRGFRKVFDPSHPDANAQGYVNLPNINLIEEMVNMLVASRSYEANVTAFQATKNMALKALEIGK